MSPWFPLVAFVATLNLLAFIIVRDRWGRITWLLLAASIGGAMAGDVVAAGTGLELFRLGDVHVVSASAGAQLAMLAVVLLAAMGPGGASEDVPPRRTRWAGRRRPRQRPAPQDDEPEQPRIAGRGARSR